MKKFLLLTLSVMAFVTPDVCPQSSSGFHFKKIQVDDGLSENTIYCILQDSKGFMWFGTKDGLNRYDGGTFRTFRKDNIRNNSLGNNFIRSMVQTGQDRLYLGTDAGLYVMDMAEETFGQINIRTPEGTDIVSAVNTIHTDTEGRLWVGTMGQGLFVYDPAAGTLRSVGIEKYSLGNNAVWSVISDKSGTIWVGTRLGLLRYNPVEGKLEAMESMFGTDDTPKNEILTMLDDNNGHLWLGTWDDGIRLLDKHTNEYTSLYGLETGSHYITHVRSIFQYTDDSLLIGSDDGLWLLDVESKAIRRLDTPQSKFSLGDQNVYSIAKDKEGCIWIGTYFGGINYLNPSLLNIETYYPDYLPGQLSGKAVSQFYEDASGNIWIATEDGGLNYFDTKTKAFSRPVPTTYHNIHALAMDGDNLWIGTFSRGIDVYDIRTRRLVNYRHDPAGASSLDDDCVFSLYRTRGGDIYAGTSAGLNRFDRASNDFRRIPEAQGFIYDMEEDDYGNLWVASYSDGAFRLDMDENKWVRYDTMQVRNNPIVGSKLTGIHIDSQKRVIFTSEGRGIFIYDYTTDNFRNISEADGLPNDVIYGVLDDAFGNLWLSCNKGLVCLNTSDPGNYKLYNKADGLQSNQFNYKSSYRAGDGKFYFGGINGFSCFYPHELSKSRNGIPPSVEITGLRLLDGVEPEREREIQSRLNRKERILLPHNLSSFTISYVGLSYVAQSKNQYSYILEGTDTQWNHVGNNTSVTYVGLPPGKYLFRVKASNNDGLWNEAGAAVEIEILPPLWLSLTACIVYFALAIALIWLAVSRLLSMNRKRQLKQLEAFKTEQETLAFKSKIDFFTTIAHEIRTPLSLIAAPLEEVIISGEGSGRTHRNLSLIDKNCDRLTELINQLLDFRKMDSSRYIVNPENIDLVKLIVDMYEHFQQIARNRNIDLELRTPPASVVNAISDYDALTKIVSNLLTNAMKFTRNKIILDLTLKPDRSYSISVEDNGRGISDDHKALILEPFYQVYKNDGKRGYGIGLSLVKHLAGILKGKIEVKDSPTGGALFVFTFSDIPQEYFFEKATSATLPQASLSDDDHYGDYDDAEVAKDQKSAVLVVDDNADLVRFIRCSLQHEYTVDTALSAVEAMRLLDSKRFDLVISDIMMPDIDGISFTKALRADLNYSHIPVIQLSAKTGNEAKIEGLLSGADIFIEKPFSISYLKAQIASLLENRRAMLEAFNRSPLASYASLATNKSDELFLDKLNGEIEKHISDENFSVESLTGVLGISRSGLQRKLKSIGGVTPGTYLRGYRLKRACKLLLETDMRINEVAFYVGFNSASYFTKAFFKAYNMSPREFILQTGKGGGSPTP